MSDRVLGILPARIASTRLPRKPLHRIAGRSLIEWVWRRAQSSRIFDALVIATDSPDIFTVAEGFGASVVMTSATHRSGTDRVAEVAERPEYQAYEFIVNLQGDEPLLADATIAAALDQVRDEPWEIGTCAVPIESESEWRDPAVVKVVTGARGRALYFSRAPIPHPRDEAPSFGVGAPWLRHLGVYAFRRRGLAAWVALALESPLETIERLEQLRALEAGLGIGVGIVPEAEGGVDTLEDAERVEQRLIQLVGTGYV